MPLTSATEVFRIARDVLFRHREDLDAARAAFRWPALDEWNWAWDWFEVLAREQPSAPALVLVREGHDEVRRSYGELAERSSRLGRWLKGRGVERGDRILVMLGNVAPLWETVLAAIKLGAVVIPATTQLTESDVDDRIERGRVRHMISDADGARKLRDPARLGVKLCVGERPGDRADELAGWLPFDEALSAPAELPRVPTRAGDPLLLYFTSGTTARPKLVLHTHASYPVGHLSTMYWLGLRPGDLHWNISSPGWAKHAWSSLFAPWNAGATVLSHDTPRFSAHRTLEVVRQLGVSTLCAPPTVWRMLILESLGARPERLRELCSAGEPLNPEVIETVRSAWGITIRDGFGQTETTAQVGNPPGLPVRLGSMGKPLPGYDVTLVDHGGREVAEGAGDGEVALRLSPRPVGLMEGYLDDAERTAAVMAGGFYRTGDEAHRDADGYIHFVGRGDDVFKSSDYRISPFELESVLIEHELVAEAAVVPSPDALRLSVPKAFVTLKPGAAPTVETARSLFEHCAARLSPYRRVRRLEFAALPKTISGKIRRVELRKLEAERRARGERGPGEYWLDEVLPHGH